MSEALKAEELKEGKREEIWKAEFLLLLMLYNSEKLTNRSLLPRRLRLWLVLYDKVLWKQLANECVENWKLRFDTKKRKGENKFICV